MIDDFEVWINWLDPKSAEIFGSGLGPFRAVHVKNELFASPCTCGREGGGLLLDGHAWNCGMRKPVPGKVVTVEMNCRHRTFPIEMFDIVPQLRKKQ